MSRWVTVAATTVIVLLLVPLTLAFPVGSAAVALGGSLLWWMGRQGWYRFALGGLTLMTLGATSTVPIVATSSAYARAPLLLLLAAVSVYATRSIPPRMSKAHAWVLGCLYTITIIAAVTILWSIDRIETVVQATSLLLLIIVVHRSSTRRWRDRGMLVDDLRVPFTLVNLTLIAGIAGHVLGLLPPGFEGRFQGLLNNPNMAAQISVPLAFIAYGLFTERRSITGMLAMAPPVITIVLTESRTATVALAVGASWVILRRGTRAFVGNVVAGLVIAAYFLAFGFSMVSSMTSRFGEVAAGDTLSGRTAIWDSALALLLARPYGYGWGTTATALDGSNADLGVSSIHQSYLQTAVEGGVVALGLLVAIYVALALVVVRTPTEGIAGGLSGVVVAGVVIHFAESGVFGTGQLYPYLYWCAVGGLLAIDTALAPHSRRAVLHGTDDDGRGRSHQGRTREDVATDPVFAGRRSSGRAG